MSALNSYFPKIFCINLDKRPDKWAECEAEFSKHGLTVERVQAVDGTTLPKHEKLTPGELGCAKSHAKVLRMIVDQGLERALVLEDDVAFIDNLQQRFGEAVGGLPQGWVLLYLGGNNLNPPVRLNSHVSKITRTFTTSSYGINNGMARACVERAENPAIQIDVMYANMQRSNCYIFHPPLAWQRPGISDIWGGHTDYTPNMRPRV